MTRGPARAGPSGTGPRRTRRSGADWWTGRGGVTESRDRDGDGSTEADIGAGRPGTRTRRRRQGGAMHAEVKGNTMPLLELILEAGESVISTHGELSWMSANVQLTQTTATGGQKGLMSGLKRAVGGGGLFLTKYEAQGGQGLLAFGAKLPGQIFEVAIAPGPGLPGPPARLGVRYRRGGAHGGHAAVVPGRHVRGGRLHPPAPGGPGPGLGRALGGDHHLRAGRGTVPAGPPRSRGPVRGPGQRSASPGCRASRTWPSGTTGSTWCR